MKNFQWKQIPWTQSYKTYKIFSEIYNDDKLVRI